MCVCVHAPACAVNVHRVYSENEIIENVHAIHFGYQDTDFVDELCQNQFNVFLDYSR